jgi:16S rRNA (guanine966-N2)-methyltransferase
MPGKTIADAHERGRRPAREPRRGAQARVLRIIAGAWRGRRLRFPAETAIRPTPDRVRETLFNWLGPAVAGAHCLDLFAGSGALGLEALSRGAASVQFIERDAVAVRELARILEEWVAGETRTPAPQGGSRSQRRVGGTWRVQRADALAWLAERPGPERQMPFDIVFLDPPFDSGLAAAAAERLERGGRLADRALIYLEQAARTPLPTLPERWVLKKSGRAGEVGYHLLERVLERAHS